MFIRSNRYEKNYNPKKLNFASNINDLKRINSLIARNFDFVIVGMTTNSEIDSGAIYRWAEASVLLPDDETVVLPNDRNENEAGRWLRSLMTA